MKTETIRVIIMYIATLLLLPLSDVLRAEDKYRLELNVVWPDSIHSNHANQCNPWCAKQDNGGRGGMIMFSLLDKHLNVGIVRIDLINSFGDPAKVEGLILDSFTLRGSIFAIGVDIWWMRIYGYTKEVVTNDIYYDEDGDPHHVKIREPIIVDTGPWPVFKACFNPLFKWTDKFTVCKRYIRFPAVDIGLVTLDGACEF